MVAKRGSVYLAIYSTFVVIVFCAAQGQEQFSLGSAGVRYGFPVTSKGRGFNEGEATLACNLPWSWEIIRWHAQMQLEGSAGWLGRSGDDAALGTAGCTLLLTRGKCPVSFEGGSLPTLLSRHIFGTKDFGTAFQFTTYAGINWDVTRHVRLGYRFQHMSNAGINKHNPGLNLHCLGVSYIF